MDPLSAKCAATAPIRLGRNPDRRSDSPGRRGAVGLHMMDKPTGNGEPGYRLSAFVLFSRVAQVRRRVRRNRPLVIPLTIGSCLAKEYSYLSLTSFTWP
jgi:hypothetical protein